MFFNQLSNRPKLRRGEFDGPDDRHMGMFRQWSLSSDHPTTRVGEIYPCLGDIVESLNSAIHRRLHSVLMLPLVHGIGNVLVSIYNVCSWPPWMLAMYWSLSTMFATGRPARGLVFVYNHMQGIGCTWRVLRVYCPHACCPLVYAYTVRLSNKKKGTKRTYTHVLVFPHAYSN